MGRSEMSKRKLGRVEVLARVGSKDLRVVDAAAVLRVSYRQARRLWKRHREEGAGRGEAPERGAGVEPGPPGGLSAEGVRAGAGQVWRAGGGALRLHAGDRHNL